VEIKARSAKIKKCYSKEKKDLKRLSLITPNIKTLLTQQVFSLSLSLSASLSQTTSDFSLFSFQPSLNY
jgi:hypothetical protein